MPNCKATKKHYASAHFFINPKFHQDFGVNALKQLGFHVSRCSLCSPPNHHVKRQFAKFTKQQNSSD